MSVARFRQQRDALFTQDIPQSVRAMRTEDLLWDIKTEPFIDPLKYLELKSRGIQP